MPGKEPGDVDTFFGDFEFDHSFPAVGQADKIYDLMDHQRASQLYLWGIPLVGMTRWHEAYKDYYPKYGYWSPSPASTSGAAS